MFLPVSPRETNEKGPHLRTRHRNGFGVKAPDQKHWRASPHVALGWFGSPFLCWLHCLHSQFCCLDIVNFATWISFCVGQVPILGEIPSNANRIAFFVSDVPCKSFACMGVYPCFAENCGPTVASFLTNFGGFAGSERRTLSTLPVSHPHFRYLDLEWLRYEFVLDNLTLQHICSSSIPFLDPQDGIPMLY